MLQTVLQQIIAAKNEFGRAQDNITLLAVSKTQPISAIKLLYQQGVHQFGENYLQEAQKKIKQLNDLAITWHFIGPLQSNKCKRISEQFDWVQSIDREVIAHKLNEHRPAHLPTLNVCIQVNISKEESKSGVLAEEVEGLCQIVNQLPRLKLRGLMCIPKTESCFDNQRQALKKMTHIYQQLKDIYQLDTLSMGMSADYRAAIAEGSTMVRIGSALFGPRKENK